MKKCARCPKPAVRGRTRCKACAEKDRKYREENQEYYKKYCEENPEKKKESARKYREKNREKLRERNRKYLEENREKLMEYKRKYREENREKLREYNKQYGQTPNGKEASRKKNLKRRSYGVSWIDYDFVVPELLKRDGDIYSWCDKVLEEPFNGKKTEVDHIRPVSKEGTSELENLQLLHAKCNTSKGNKLVHPETRKPYKSRRMQLAHADCNRAKGAK